MFNNLTNSYFYKPVLILDLDNTLINTYYMDDDNIKFNYRPGLINFLNIIKNYYTIFIFTAATKLYADYILDIIEDYEIGKYFEKRYYRDDMTYDDPNNYFIPYKDIKLPLYDNFFEISNLNRTIIIDDLEQNIKINKDNAIHIKPFIDDEDDKALYILIPHLINFSLNKNIDIKTFLNNNLTYLSCTKFFYRL